jgi:sugar transferase EpsL
MKLQNGGKRVFDVVTASLGLVACAPLVGVVAALVATTMGRPVLFTQERAGKGGRSFLMYKFRTMTEARDATGALLPDENRITALGRVLRATSIDELPELLNVLRGEMSLVGPRPLPIRYLERYSPAHARRHEVKPGITGWAQVNGRNAISWPTKFDLDVWYVDHCSIALDLRILGRTIWTLLRREGINQPGQATMEEFCGYTDGR